MSWQGGAPSPSYRMEVRVDGGTSAVAHRRFDRKRIYDRTTRSAPPPQIGLAYGSMGDWLG
jgi:hypothetical protein